MTLPALRSFLDTCFPAETRSSLGELVELDEARVRMSLEPTPGMERPGALVSGPALMAFADIAAYAAVLAHHGPEAMAVTSNLSIAFLRACRFERVLADARLLRLGRRIATVDVRVWQRTESRLVAQATVSYSLP